MIINLHRLDIDNLGDQASSPRHYFDLGIDRVVDVLEPEWPAADTYIVGGGGLLGQGWENRLASLVDTTPVIFWGTGSNIHHETVPSWPDYVGKALLAGIRDHQNPYCYVPCPSCMHPAFDELRGSAPKHGICLYEHHLQGVPLSGIMRISNQQPFTAFADVLRFMAQAEIVISSSYHGLYWAMLLGRKALCYQPASTRYYGFKHNPRYVDEGNWMGELDSLETYPDYLDECRAANVAFAAEVKEILCLT